MSPQQGVPQRGDGFDTGGGHQQGGHNSAGGNLGKLFGNLDLTQLNPLLDVIASPDEKQKRIIRDSATGLTAAAGAAALTDLIGEAFGDEWAGMVGGAIGGYLGGRISKKIAPRTIGGNKNKKRPYKK